MNREESIALFERCEAARRQALDAGRNEVQAHEAAKAVWNAWAEPLIAERKALEKAGKWEVAKQFDASRGAFAPAGKNAETAVLLHRSEINLISLRFVPRASVEHELQRGNGVGGAGAKIRTIYNETEFISFVGYIFPGNAWFNDSTFSADTFFIAVEFSGAAGFIKASFLGESWFSEATFLEEVRFSKVPFADDCRFDGAIFSGDAWFSDATFSGVVGFDGARFSGDAWFGRVMFFGRTYFDTANFYGNALFSGSRFFGNASSVAHFVQAIFFGQAEFDCVTFTGDALFQDAIFERYATFGASTFASKASFTAIDAKRAFDLAGADFETEVPDFTQAHFEEAPRLDNIAVPKVPFWAGARDKDEASRFQALKRLAIQGHDHVREQEFFAGELRCRRSDHPLRFELMKAGVVDGGRLFFAGLRREAIWSFPYDLLSAHGRSIWRPLAGLAASIWFAAEGYESLAGDVTTCPDKLESAWFLALKNGLLFLGSGQKTEVEAAYQCLYGVGKANGGMNYEGLPAAVGYLGIGQGIVSAIFIFLALLALRNLFKIK